MRKFIITIANVASTVNCGEYSVFPKTNLFKTAEGNDAASTSGKGKSAVNNFYLYFKQDGVIFYFKTTAEQIALARTEGYSVLPDLGEATGKITFADQNVDGTLDTAIVAPTTAKVKRVRVPKAVAA